MNVEEKVLKFKVQSFRRIPNPYSTAGDGDKNAEMCIAICDVKDIPDNIPMETNPREQKMTTNVVKRIKESLLNGEELNFYLLNRGILLSAKSVSYSQYTGKIEVTFEDAEVHGNVDGGHTYRTILQNRESLEKGKQFVKIEILTGIEGIFQSLAAARNTSVQVQDKSIAELENRFDIIKKALSSEGYLDRIFFKENDTTGDIDIADILAMLNMFNIDRYVGMSTFPVNSYNLKKKCIDLYIEEHKKFGESAENPYVKMVPVMRDIFALFDKIEVNMNRFYREKYPNGRYGAVKGVQVPQNAEVKFHSKFMRNEMDFSSPNGFTYPILGAFRAMLEERDGAYHWKKDPFEILESVGPDLVDSTISISRSLGNNPQFTGKNVITWKNLYMIVALTAIS